VNGARVPFRAEIERRLTEGCCAPFIFGTLVPLKSGIDAANERTK
jgi:hypothetical protein